MGREDELAREREEHRAAMAPVRERMKQEQDDREAAQTEAMDAWVERHNAEAQSKSETSEPGTTEPETTENETTESETTITETTETETSES